MRRRKTGKSRSDAPKTQELEVHPSLVEGIRKSELTVVRILCPDKRCSMNVVVRNSETREPDQTSFPQITIASTWDKVKDLLEPGAKLVFISKKGRVACTFYGSGRDIIFSEDGLMVEAIIPDKN
ncbi:MAG: hypothetical protein AB1324_04570 [Candidatus Micrarchaeota archaeon]